MEGRDAAKRILFRTDVQYSEFTKLFTWVMRLRSILGADFGRAS